jgi:hypothetical protein
VGLPQALGLGILFQGSESAVSLSLGLVSLVGLSGISPQRRRVTLIALGGAGSAAAAILGVTLVA